MKPTAEEVQEAIREKLEIAREGPQVWELASIERQQILLVLVQIRDALTKPRFHVS